MFTYRIPVLGPQLVAGPELAEAASQALGTKLEFSSVTEAQAKKILGSEGEELDDGESGPLEIGWTCPRALAADTCDWPSYSQPSSSICLSTSSR